jgi:hypothetical protein
LQKQGDLQRRVGDVQAATTYNMALELLEKVVTDDPTSFTALSAIDLTRHGIRLLGPATQADVATAERRKNVNEAIDRAFAEGIGRFHFGMTYLEVNKLLREPFGEKDISQIPRAWEYETGDVRYIWKWLKDEPGLAPLNLSACLLKSGYIVLMFHEGTLFRIVFRFMQDTDPCPERSTAVDTLARRFGVPSTGSSTARRFRHESERVAVMAVSDSYAISFDIIQR